MTMLYEVDSDAGSSTPNSVQSHYSTSTSASNTSNTYANKSKYFHRISVPLGKHTSLMMDSNDNVDDIEEEEGNDETDYELTRNASASATATATRGTNSVSTPEHHQHSLLAQFELNEMIPFNLCKHLYEKLQQEMRLEAQLRGGPQVDEDQIDKLYYLLISLCYIKAFKQVYSTIKLEQNKIDLSKSEENIDKDEEKVCISDLKLISHLQVYVPERIDMLLCGLGNLVTPHGKVCLLWPKTTLLTLLVNAIHYGLLYFNEKIISRKLPNFESGIRNFNNKEKRKSGDMKFTKESRELGSDHGKGVATQLIWSDYEGYEKFQTYCSRYLSQFGDVEQMCRQNNQNELYQFHLTHPEYSLVYEASLCLYLEWRKRINKYDESDVIVSALSILGLQFVTIQSTILKNMTLRIVQAYTKYEAGKFEKMWKMKNTRGTGKGMLGQLCKEEKVENDQRLSMDSKGSGNNNDKFGQHCSKLCVSAFPFTGINKTFGNMLKPSRHYDIVDSEAALLLFQDIINQGV